MRLTDRARAVLLIVAVLAVLIVVMGVVGTVDLSADLPNDR